MNHNESKVKNVFEAIKNRQDSIEVSSSNLIYKHQIGKMYRIQFLPSDAQNGKDSRN